MIIFKKNKPETKTISLSREDMSELGFYGSCQKQHEIEMTMWRNIIDSKKQQILNRFGAGKEWSPNWENVLQTGKLVITKVPEPTVEPQTEQPKNEAIA